ncbi:enterochelin esterase-like enzyme/preprotein translocase subunit SecG [Kitasatospora sp. MAP12-15]|uniref:alpha/beta hydrolase n=1 Tax=unclassified Kitasatospora TaxID=2633591 RepID=UPI0024732D94|nr:alpha/beta hydrolase-fold protein [Kitasatospora sp. MAP12-44]MDH6114537.1 enterochelin esterase-like enzyme/preprotein translocase subunit SecG [Kitasatospora sp. MAP12-44]
MQLTGTPFFILTIILFMASIGLAMLQWGRGRGGGAAGEGGRAVGGRGRAASRRRGSSGPGLLRTLGYLGTILLCQATAVTMVFVMVNDSNLLYDSWGDLLGTSSHVRAVPPPPADHGLAADAAQPQTKVIQTFKPVDDPAVPGDVKTTDLKGRLSGVDGEVVVWTPPQYDDPAYKDKTFPVVELLAGFPGSSSAWFGSMDVSKQLAPLMTSGQVTPFILISPRVNLIGSNEYSGCADVPGRVNAETWFTRDVPQMILDNFRVDPSADRWALGGYSAGAFCATKLALSHPDRFRAAIAMSGYNDPSGESSAITAKDPHLKEIGNTLYILTHAPTPPNVALWETGKKGDGLEDAIALQQAAKAPTTVTPFENPGPHLVSTWKPMVPAAFKWLSTIIPATH